MTRHWFAIAVILAALLGLAGCAGKIKYPSYYTLNVPSPPDPPTSEGVRTTLAIREFRSPSYLHQGAIVYKDSPEAVGFYAYHRWAVDPRDFVTSAVADHLRASGSFAQVKIYDGRPDVDYVLSGRLEKLEELDYDGGVKVEVAISAQMTKLATGETVWSKEATDVGTVAQRNVPAIVSEMSLTMQRTIDKLLTPPPGSNAK